MANVLPSGYVPSSTLGVEYWVQEGSGTAEQIFGVQSFPDLFPEREDITWSSLELLRDMTMPGKIPATSLSLEIVFFKAQHDNIKSLDGKELTHYLYIPKAGFGFRWTGEFSYSPIGAIEQNGTLTGKAKVGMSSDPVEIETVPGRTENT